MLPALFRTVPFDRHPVALSAAAAGAAGVVVWSLYALLRRRPTAEERERLRRDRLAAGGRYVAGILFDALPSETDPATVFYRYSIAGVEYQCAQDVSALRYRIDGVTLDFPVMVRYDRANPTDSIVLAEEWSGLHALPADAHASGSRRALGRHPAR